MPPVPLYEWTSCPFWVLQMWTHLSPSPRPTTELLSQKRRSPEQGSCSGYLCLVL